MADIFSIFLLEQEIRCQDSFQKLSLQTNYFWFLIADRIICF